MSLSTLNHELALFKFRLDILGKNIEKKQQQPKTT